MSVLLCQKAVPEHPPVGLKYELINPRSSISEVKKKKAQMLHLLMKIIQVFSPQGHKCIPDGLSNWTMIILCSPSLRFQHTSDQSIDQVSYIRVVFGFLPLRDSLGQILISPHCHQNYFRGTRVGKQWIILLISVLII